METQVDGRITRQEKWTLLRHLKMKGIIFKCSLSSSQSEMSTFSDNPRRHQIVLTSAHVRIAYYDPYRHWTKVWEERKSLGC